MVQFRDEDDFQRLRSDSYWKLGLHHSQSARQTIWYLQDRGYQCRKNATKTATKKTALDLLGRYQRGLMSYEGLGVLELRSLCDARGLSTKATTAGRLTRALEKADDNATFRLLDLPPEIRNLIYELHFSDFDEISTSYAQPPLTLASKQLRAEALPLFYGCATFVCGIDDYDVFEDRFTEDAERLLRMPAASLSQIKNFTVRWKENTFSNTGDGGDEILAFQFTSRNVTDKAFDITTSYDAELDEILHATVRDFGYWNDDFKLQLRHIEALKAAATEVMG
jgi:hypothetical protein